MIGHGSDDAKPNLLLRELLNRALRDLQTFIQRFESALRLQAFQQFAIEPVA